MLYTICYDILYYFIYYMLYTIHYSTYAIYAAAQRQRGHLSTLQRTGEDSEAGNTAARVKPAARELYLQHGVSEKHRLQGDDDTSVFSMH